MAVVPVAEHHADAVEGHDLLLAMCVVIDPPCRCRCFGDDTIHIATDVPGDDPGSIIFLHQRQVANLYPKRQRKPCGGLLSPHEVFKILIQQRRPSFL